MSIKHIKRLMPAAMLAATLLSCNAQPSSNGTSKEGDPPAKTSGARRASYADAATVDDGITNSRQNAITRAVATVSPAVVGINVTEVREVRYRDPWADFFDDPMFKRYFGRRSPQTYKQEIRGLGSGFLISADGYIVTNDHVAGSATKVVVTMTDGKHFDATVIGSDPTTDVALLKIEGSNLPHLSLGNSDEVLVGEWAIALGNPFGLFDINSKPTVTVGVVSNTKLDLGPQDNRAYRGMIQTDAAISSGNSGGPLVNSLGQVIGMNTVIYSTSQSQMGAGSIGIGFAVPVNRVKQTVDLLRSGNGIDRGFWTGMRVQQIDPNIARYLELKTTDGVVVVETAPGSPATRAGIEAGDVIVAVNGEPVRTEKDAILYLTDARVGDVMKLKILRGGKESDKTLTLTKRGS